VALSVYGTTKATPRNGGRKARKGGGWRARRLYPTGFSIVFLLYRRSDGVAFRNGAGLAVGAAPFLYRGAGASLRAQTRRRLPTARREERRHAASISAHLGSRRYLYWLRLPQPQPVAVVTTAGVRRLVLTTTRINRRFSVFCLLSAIVCAAGKILGGRTRGLLRALARGWRADMERRTVNGAVKRWRAPLPFVTVTLACSAAIRLLRLFCRYRPIPSSCHPQADGNAGASWALEYRVGGSARQSVVTAVGAVSIAYGFSMWQRHDANGERQHLAAGDGRTGTGRRARRRVIAAQRLRQNRQAGGLRQSAFNQASPWLAMRGRGRTTILICLLALAGVSPFCGCCAPPSDWSTTAL